MKKISHNITTINAKLSVQKKTLKDFEQFFYIEFEENL